VSVSVSVSVLGHGVVSECSSPSRNVGVQGMEVEYEGKTYRSAWDMMGESLRPFEWPLVFYGMLQVALAVRRIDSDWAEQAGKTKDERAGGGCGSTCLGRRRPLQSCRWVDPVHSCRRSVSCCWMCPSSPRAMPCVVCQLQLPMQCRRESRGMSRNRGETGI
jgi:hypothetical protein